MLFICKTASESAKLIQPLFTYLLLWRECKVWGFGGEKQQSVFTKLEGMFTFHLAVLFYFLLSWIRSLFRFLGKDPSMQSREGRQKSLMN